MKIKLDENIPQSVVGDLEGIGHDVLSTHQQGMQGISDTELWDAVQAEGRFLITQDLDFSDISMFKPGTHAGILLVRLRHPGRLMLRRMIWDLFSYDLAATDWTGFFIVLTEHKVRIQSP
jgi:predicted nuclease of predicted toxin-antitoxin system